CLVEPHVHVWTLDLDANPAEVGRLSALLCPEERERAARFHFDHHRRRFIVGRGLLRSILGEYSGVPPERVEFAYGIHGKPALSHGPEGGNLQFNLAHSENVGLLAVTAGSRIGVDVERIRKIEDLDGLVARFFSPRESRLFENLPLQQKPEAFFNLWTRKEAWLKATGEGIGDHLNRVEVSFLPAEPARLLSLPAGFGPEATWSLHDLDPASGFAGALAIEAKQPRISCWCWNQERSDD